MYTSWVLIITLVFYSTPSARTMPGILPTAAVAVHSVPDFQSRKECMEAGKVWFDDFNGYQKNVNGTYVCVQRTIDLPAADQF